MDRETPKPGEQWRHYKLKDGREYIVHIVAIGQYSSIYFNNIEDAVIYTKDLIAVINELARYSNFIVKNTDSEELLEVQMQGDQWILRPAMNPITNLATERKPIGYARAVSEFMDYIEEKQVNRFERTG